MESLERRVLRLERQLRRQRAWSAILLLGLAAVVTLGVTRNTPEVLRAQRFEVVTPGGQAVVLLRSTVYGGQVQTVGKDGISGVSLGATASGGFVGVRDARPSLFPRVELSTDDTGGMLAVRNWRGFAVEVDRDGLAIAHTQEDGNFTRVDPRVVLGVNEYGGHLRVLNATGSEAVVLRADDRGIGTISTTGHGGTQHTLRPER